MEKQFSIHWYELWALCIEDWRRPWWWWEALRCDVWVCDLTHHKSSQRFAWFFDLSFNYFLDFSASFFPSVIADWMKIMLIKCEGCELAVRVESLECVDDNFLFRKKKMKRRSLSGWKSRVFPSRAMFKIVLISNCFNIYWATWLSFESTILLRHS